MAASRLQEKYGVVYCITAERYVDEAELSIQSLRRHDAKIPVVVCVSDDLKNLHWAKALEVEVQVLKTVTRSFSDKIYAMQNCGLDRLIYLDTDVYVAEGVRDLLDLLDDYDIAACHAPVRLNYPEYETRQLSDAVPQLNTGVIIMRNNDTLFTEWANEQQLFAHWMEQNPTTVKRYFPDQVGLRLAVHKRGDLRLLVLPPEYNLRPMQSYSGRPRLIHDRGFLQLPDAQQNRLLGWMSRPTGSDPRGPNPGHLRPKVAFLYPRTLLRRVFNSFRRSRGRVLDL